MCTSPILLKTNSHYFHNDAGDMFSYKVSCGHCFECEQSARNDWNVRCFIEFEYTIKNGGIVFFYTLTFDNKHLPTSFGFKHFDKSLVQKFLKRLRKHIQFRYLLTSEYGEKFGRPHHHVIFFVTSYIKPLLFKLLLQKTWQQGIVKEGNNIGVVNSNSALKYVTKYITKNVYHNNLISSKLVRVLMPSCYSQITNLLQLDDEKLILDFPKYFPDDSLLPTELKQYRKNVKDLQKKWLRSVLKLELKKFVAFHLQSKGLGYHPEQFHVDYECGCISILDPSGIKKFPIPSYISRKLFCNIIKCPVTGNNLYRLNDDGILFKAFLLENKVTYLTDYFVSLSSYILSSNNFKVKDYDTIKLFQSRSFARNVAIYSLVYAGRIYNDSLVFSNYIDNFLDYSLNNQTITNYVPTYKEMFIKPKLLLCDSIYKDLNNALSIICFYSLELHNISLKDKQLEFNTIKKIKDFLKR